MEFQEVDLLMKQVVTYWMVTWSHLANQKHQISPLREFMVSKLASLVTYYKELPPIYSHDSLITFLLRSGDKLNTLHIHLQKTYRYQARQDGVLPWETPTLKVTWPFYHVTNASSVDNLNYLLKDLCQLNLAGCWLLGGGSERKHLSRHRLFVPFALALNLLIARFNVLIVTNKIVFLF